MKPIAIVLALVAVFAGAIVVAGDSTASDDAAAAAKARGPVKLDKRGKVPANLLPKVPRARNADRLGGKAPKTYVDQCSPDTVDLGTICLMSNPYPLDKTDIGKNDYFYASQKCVELGGYLPTAAQLVGAADRVKLSSTIDDDQLTASIDLDPSDGLKDRREMSSTLVTTAAGGRSAGSQGVTEGSRGDPRAGEPDPVPQPANPSPETLQYVTVYDNRDRGGFAGAKPVGQPENFRCVFNKAQGNAGELG